MRISEHEKEIIVEAATEADPFAKVWLFGSRTDDSKRGGDIDIAILSEMIKNDVMKEIQVRRYICDRIGEQKIDIVASAEGKEVFFRLAVEEGIELK